MEWWEWFVLPFAALGTVLSWLRVAVFAVVLALVLLALFVGSGWLWYVEHQLWAAIGLAALAFAALWWICCVYIADFTDKES